MPSAAIFGIFVTPSVDCKLASKKDVSEYIFLSYKRGKKVGERNFAIYALKRLFIFGLSQPTTTTNIVDRDSKSQPTDPFSFFRGRTDQPSRAYARLKGRFDHGFLRRARAPIADVFWVDTETRR